MSMDGEYEACGCGCGCGAPETRPNDMPDWAAAPGETLVCHCCGVSKKTLVQAIEMGAYTLALVKAATGACRGKECEEKNPLGRCCAPDIQELIRLYHTGPPEWLKLGGC